MLKISHSIHHSHMYTEQCSLSHSPPTENILKYFCFFFGWFMSKKFSLLWAVLLYFIHCGAIFFNLQSIQIVQIIISVSLSSSDEEPKHTFFRISYAKLATRTIPCDDNMYKIEQNNDSNHYFLYFVSFYTVMLGATSSEVDRRHYNEHNH